MQESYGDLHALSLQCAFSPTSGTKSQQTTQAKSQKPTNMPNTATTQPREKTQSDITQGTQQQAKTSDPKALAPSCPSQRPKA